MLEPQRIKSDERAKRLLIPPVCSLRGISAYDELQIVGTEVGQVKQTVTIHKGRMHSYKEKDRRVKRPRSISCFILSPDSTSYVP